MTVGLLSIYKPQTGVVTFSVLPIGGGGFVTGHDTAADGTKIIRTDTIGPWLWNGTRWVSLVTMTSMPSADRGVNAATILSNGAGLGAWAGIISQNNTNRLYMFMFGYPYYSTNKGGSWTRGTGFTQDFTAAANGQFRTCGPYMAADPANDTVCFAGTPSGLFKSADGGASWSQVSGGGWLNPSDTSHAGVMICFDPSSTVTAGITQGIYAFSYGHGCYHSTDAGATWTLLNGSGFPTTALRMRVASTGILYVVDNSGSGNGNLKRCASGTWSTPISGNYCAVAVNPTDPTKVYVAANNSQIAVSVDSGVTFGPQNSLAVTSSDIPWLAQSAVDGQFSCADIDFDKANTANLVLANGVGFFTTTAPTVNTAVTVTWASQTLGLENLDFNQIKGNISGHPMITGWDRPVFTPDLVHYPSNYGVDDTGGHSSNGLQTGWSGDISIALDAMVVLATPQPGVTPANSGISTNNGASWIAFSSQAPQSTNSTWAGAMACSTALNIVWIPTENGTAIAGIWNTKDGGATWNIHKSGAGSVGWQLNFFSECQNLAADRVDTGTFYAYNFGGTNSPGAGFWKSTDQGDTWINVNSSPGLTGGTNVVGFFLKSVPGQSGHLFMSNGSQGVSTHPAAANLIRSTDHGTTWAAVSNVKEPWAIGFGLHAPGQTYPAIYLVGWVSLDSGATYNYGFWQSVDNAVTWTMIGDGYPTGSFSPICDIDGDMGIYGQGYAVTHNQGAFMFTTS